MINKLFLKNQKNLNLISEKHNFYLNLTYFAAELHITMIFSPESEVAQNKIKLTTSMMLIIRSCHINL
jgi:hypothetical protein